MAEKNKRAERIEQAWESGNFSGLTVEEALEAISINAWKETAHDTSHSNTPIETLAIKHRLRQAP